MCYCKIWSLWMTYFMNYDYLKQDVEGSNAFTRSTKLDVLLKILAPAKELDRGISEIAGVFNDPIIVFRRVFPCGE